MKAYLLDSFGPPENLRLGEAEKPSPGPGEVLVRVRATSINPYDWHHMRGEPVIARFMDKGLGHRPGHPILGCDVAGEVEAVGPGVTRFRSGDPVYALVPHGAFAQYVLVAEEHLAAKPQSLTFEQAAAVPMAAVTALVALRDDARTAAGQRILVNGASGGVGTFAVQLGRAFGAEVTGVCSGRNVELVRSIGAAHVIDYTAQAFTRTARGFDALIDVAGSPSVWAARRVLRPGGGYIVVGGDAGRWVRPVDHMIGAALMGKLSRQPVAVTAVRIGAASARDLTELTPLFDSGAVTPVVARRYPFTELPDAVRFVEQGHAPGKVVVIVE
ncbi:NAD(P)-dependent alcohol dehydrogenase [Catellatospora sp. KI3]|uniref:NAD(P)-dependent alcohol dehydrogenase n=1 Tax=Catellatospora sp. KI3 TaxID=3041620 RepID=UPI0024830EA5|nr:NAD(P)-dependent alcohol dehydrogenase [Catellatospora sp. KI3]MDI1464082.1 NAD(P)-dependent alcohol dehydrogenase [Catellatospora sp. KI3]